MGRELLTPIASYFFTTPSISRGQTPKGDVLWFS